MLSIVSSFNEGFNGECKLIREYLPSTELPALVENYALINTGKQSISIEIPAMEYKQTTAPEKGVDGSYSIEMTVDKTDTSTCSREIPYFQCIHLQDISRDNPDRSWMVDKKNKNV